jgi:hypothetical protein
LFIVRHPKVVFVEYSPKQKLTKSLTSVRLKTKKLCNRMQQNFITQVPGS